MKTNLNYKPGRSKRVSQLNRFFGGKQFSVIFAVISATVLMLTTVLWSYWSSLVQRQNADQLVNGYLFESWTTFQGAILPAQHTFFLKWPLFALLGLFHNMANVVMMITLALALLSIAGLSGLLFKIERRPLVWGTYNLALASMLLLVPAQAYAGGLLPVNLAMITTRNIEYLLLLLVLWLSVRAQSFKSRQTIFSVALLALLMFSDHLFVALWLAASFGALVVYSLLRRWQLVSLAARWAAIGLVAVALSVVLGLIVRLSGVSIGSETALSPYSVISAPKDLVVGTVFLASGWLTNFGANPAYDVGIIKNLPGSFLGRLFGLGGPAYLINLALAIGLMGTAVVLFVTTFRRRLSAGRAAGKHDDWYLLALGALWINLAAIGAFIATKHYSAVDARYLGFAFFALPLAAAVRLRRWKISPLILVTSGGLLIASAGLGVAQAHRVFRAELVALASVQDRNQTVAQSLQRRSVRVLVGDYWRVLPIKDQAKSLTVEPLASCNEPRTVLTSRAWQPDLAKTGFAYLLPLEKGLTDFPACSLRKVVKQYGQPSSSLLIAGTYRQPKELLLFYDYGAHPGPPSTGNGAQALKAVLPVKLQDFTQPDCNAATVMNVVAHQDDDLLFINPDTLRSIQAGDCVRTVYVTAGDSGSGKNYWLGRQLGSQAAYAKMLGVENRWGQRIVRLAAHEYATIVSPVAAPQVSLVYLHLPDGNMHGEGFGPMRESLKKLENGQIEYITSVDNQSRYDRQGLSRALAALMETYGPSEIRTTSLTKSRIFPDHSDHLAVSLLTAEAYDIYMQQQFGGAAGIPLVRYDGYPIHGYPPNLGPADITAKTAIFLAYAQHDNGVCQTAVKCHKSATYGSYLERQYRLAP